MQLSRFEVAVFVSRSRSLVMDINTVSGACAYVAFNAACVSIFVVFFTPVGFWLFDKMFLLLDKAFPLTPKN